ncbi:hypothetical protein BDV41DRAFT_565942 [Aspergillus transmontanensis]|uniref:Aminoglycoside phosphotransferase domain-containing protein n=1 Tax=Aspergillus transmontanensis TaxID=1034304 RepID=A0A5N6VS14_9EURO|nr:hypothetical protein BDV41DRAFT_565942 [Aspergillus transmontanensis]
MPHQQATLPLLRGTTTLELAIEEEEEEEEDMLPDLDYPEQRIDFFVSLYSNRGDIVSYHLGLGQSETCRLADVNEWVHGSFSVCIPVYINKQSQQLEKRALIRFPLPYKLGESKYPGNVDEKLRCEAATYISIKKHCLEVPTPQLWSFGLVGGQSNTPFTTRIPWSFKRYILWLLGSTPSCNYVCHRRLTMLESGYLLMDYVGNSEVQMLSETWDKDHHHRDKRINLFRGLSRIMLSLSQIPLPRIGSWTLDPNGALRLSNRPLTLRLHQLENGGIPTNIGRTLTHPAADAYYLDLLASTFFVDRHWHVKCLVDLEWACSLPAETLRPPYWLTGRSIDDLTGEHLEAFKKVYEEFLDVFEEEEKSFPFVDNTHSYRTDLMRRAWQTGSFWHFHSLDSPKGLFNLFHQQIHPIFVSAHRVGSELPRIVSDYWAVDTETIISTKLQDKAELPPDIRRKAPRKDDAHGRNRLGCISRSRSQCSQGCTNHVA